MQTCKKISLNFSWLKTKPQESVIGTDIDYYKLFYVLKQQNPSCYLFESLTSFQHRDRYVTIGFDPVMEFIAKGDQLRIVADRSILEQTLGIADQMTTITVDNPYRFLQQNIPLQFLSKTHQGGLIGYFSYESVNYFEPAIQLEEHPDFATFHLGLYTDGLIYDNETGILHYYTFYEDRKNYVEALVEQLDRVTIPTQLKEVKCLGHSISREEYAQAICNTLEEIKAGNTFQCEVGFKTFYEISGDKMPVYDRLRKINPSPYMFYVQFDDVELLGASPELLVSSVNRNVLTSPMAGTIRRGKDSREDQVLAQQLLSDPKEIAEHHMLVDLHRNDLARVCNVGSVLVSNLMYILQFSHVQHMVSDIVGKLSEKKDAYDLLAAILPGGVVTGAPKIETIQIIDRNENTPRGPYGGAIGRFSFNGDAHFCLSIRSLFCKGNRCFTQTSSGVVYDSSVEREYEEVCRKLAAMDQTICALERRGGSNDE